MLLEAKEERREGLTLKPQVLTQINVTPVRALAFKKHTSH